MSSPADRSRSFFAARHLVTRTRRDGDDYCVDLVSSSGGFATSQYGRGANEETALFRAMKRYQVEQADWDQEAIEIANATDLCSLVQWLSRNRLTYPGCASCASADRFGRPPFQVRHSRLSSAPTTKYANTTAPQWASIRITPQPLITL